MSAVAWGRLLRLSLAPSAAADALAGMTLGAWGAFPLDARAALLPLASLCVFHGGMALNDWADRAGDARTRPERPIPSGAVPPSSALRVAIALLALGPLLAAAVAPLAGACLAGVALTAGLYDVTGRGALLGPTLLGLCRAGNLASGVLAGDFLKLEQTTGPPNWAWAACVLYGLYVFATSLLARLEDDEDAGPLGGRPRKFLVAALGCLAASPFLVFAVPGPSLNGGLDPGEEVVIANWALLSAPWILAPVVALLSAVGLWKEARDEEPWTRQRVARAAGLCLRRLLVFTTVVAWCAPIGAARAGTSDFRATYLAYLVAPLLLLGYPIALRLRRVFPPT